MKSPTGRLIIYAKATHAAEELRKIRERCTDARKWLRDHSFYGGGPTPCGYLPGRADGTTHQVLAADPEYQAIMRDIADRVQRGASTQLLALELNRHSVLTWRDRLRVFRREEQKRRREPVTAPLPNGHRWTTSVLRGDAFSHRGMKVPVAVGC